MTTPAVARTRDELDGLLGRAAVPSRRAFVPTMGALHEGHASLMRAAREQVGPDGSVVVSIFVNPTQFGAGEDLDRYPRTFDADLELAGREGVDVVFAPSVSEVYPSGFVPAGEEGSTVTVDPGPLATVLEGASRPGHFRGVLTVVAKLFGLVRPDVAVFGEKDYQQLALVRQMVTDLCMGIDVVGAPTDREPDGLARSSRNRYLDRAQRVQAVALSRVLRRAAASAHEGYAAAVAAGRAELRASEGVDLDYFEIRGADLAELADDVPPGTPARALIAARVGTTRLIDNLPLVIGTRAPEGSAG